MSTIGTKIRKGLRRGPLSRTHEFPPLEKGVRGDFAMDSFGQIPLNPPFSKGEVEVRQS
jgi:hypothetical protein